MTRSIAICFLTLLASASLRGAEPIPLNSEPRLFIDDQLIESMTGLKRTLHHPTDIASNPVMAPDKPWEHRRIPYGSVLYFPEEKKFKCWYLAMNIYDSRPGARGYRKEFHVPLHEAAFICYAESIDGLTWTKHDLGLRDFRGSKKNNILLTCPGSHFDSLSVIHTPRDKAHPYKMMTFIGRWPYKDDLIRKQWGKDFKFGVDRHAHYAWSSKDGIHWMAMNDGEPVLRAHDRSMFWRDEKKGIYVGAAKQSHDGKRAQRHATSPDFVNWTLTPDWILRANERDQPGDEGEAAYGFNYGAQYLGFAEIRRIRKGQETKINWQLLSSQDGRHWERPFRELFFADGPKESWRYQVFKIFANPPIEKDGKLLIYYGGKTGAVPVDRGYEPFQALCLATLRKDGFVSLDAGPEGGELITKPLRLAGDTLRVNANAHGGEIRVGLLGEDGIAIDGNGVEDCLPIRLNELNAPVRWKTNVDIPAFGERPIRLKIILRNTSLYSIRCQ